MKGTTTTVVSSESRRDVSNWCVDTKRRYLLLPILVMSSAKQAGACASTSTCFFLLLHVSQLSQNQPLLYMLY